MCDAITAMALAAQVLTAADAAFAAVVAGQGAACAVAGATAIAIVAAVVARFNGEDMEVNALDQSASNLLETIDWPEDMAAERMLFNRIMKSEPETLAEWHREGVLFETLTAMVDGKAELFLSLMPAMGPLEAAFYANTTFCEGEE